MTNTLVHPTSRAQARAEKSPVYYSSRCEIDGCYTHNTDTGKCTECERYSKAIFAGRIQGIDGRIKGKQYKPVKVEMCAEEREARSLAIKAGWKRRKKMRNEKSQVISRAALFVIEPAYEDI